MSWRAFRSFAQIRAISCTNSPFVRNIRTKSLFIASSRGNGAKHCGKTGQKAIPTLVVEHKELAAVFLFRRDFLIQFEPFTTAAGFDLWLPFGCRTPLALIVSEIALLMPLAIEACSASSFRAYNTVIRTSGHS
jgi:hypothetical protein